jgi:tetratricopeptide (TPR) repeat protein/uncharacterized membrane protein
MRAFAALLLLIASCAPALATVKVCNQFSHPLHLAFAYEGKDGWTSDGWLTVAPNACEIDTQHPDLTSFYYRAESDTYGGNKWTTWGSDREFSVKDGNFKLDHAEQKVPDGRFVKFNGPDSYIDPFTVVTLTFFPDLKVTFSVPNENAGAPPGGVPASPSAGGAPASPPISGSADPKSDPDYKTCENSQGDEAIAGCERAMASGKYSGSLLAALYIDRGVAQRDDDRAIADYSKAIELDPGYALAYQNRSRRYYNNNDYKRALADVNKAIELDPKDARSYQVRGWVYEGKRDTRHALADYDKAIEVDPKFAQPLVDRGNIYFNRGDYTHALADFDKAIELDSNYALAYCNRGAISARRNQYDQAIADYNKAIELNPKLVLAYTNRAVAHENSGSVGAAIADYTHALELDSNNELSKSALKRLQGFYFNPNERVQ